MLTPEQIRNRTKTVTRRMGWKNVKPGDLLQAVVKCQGLKKGEKVEKLAVIRVTAVRRERLRHILLRGGHAFTETRREGFPGMRPCEFVAFFCASHKKCTPDTEVTRIEFEYVQEGGEE